MPKETALLMRKLESKINYLTENKAHAKVTLCFVNGVCTEIETTVKERLIKQTGQPDKQS